MDNRSGVYILLLNMFFYILFGYNYFLFTDILFELLIIWSLFLLHNYWLWNRLFYLNLFIRGFFFLIYLTILSYNIFVCLQSLLNLFKALIILFLFSFWQTLIWLRINFWLLLIFILLQLYFLRVILFR